MEAVLNLYESIVVINPTITEEEKQAVLDKIKNYIESNKGVLIETNEWGRKKLAYRIKKFRDGIYFLLTFSAFSTIIDELLNLYKLEDDILRSIVVKIDPKKRKSNIDEEISSDTFEDITPQEEEVVIPEPEISAPKPVEAVPVKPSIVAEEVDDTLTKPVFVKSELADDKEETKPDSEVSELDDTSEAAPVLSGSTEDRMNDNIESISVEMPKTDNTLIASTNEVKEESISEEQTEDEKKDIVTEDSTTTVSESSLINDNKNEINEKNNI